MNFHHKRGKIGEDAACIYLESLGYNILGRNVKAGGNEIDIVARDKEVMIFVEVKTALIKNDNLPDKRVNKKKENKISNAAGLIREYYKYEGEIRFDIISVTLYPKVEITHIKDAFFPGLF